MNQFQLMSAFASLAAIAAVASPAHASPLYLAAHVGQTQSNSVGNINFSDGLAYGAGVGGALGPIRVEAGVDRLSGSLAGGAVQAQANDYSASAYLDVPVGSLTVSGGAGMDYVQGTARAPVGSAHASGTGWHWSLGGSTRISEHLIAEIEYRHLQADLGGPGTMRSDQIMTGIRIPI